MFYLKLLLVGLLFLKCGLCYRIVKNPFDESEEYTNANIDDFVEEYDMENEKTLNVIDNPELQTEFWQTNGQQTMKLHLTRTHNKNIAKNVIFFIGDGMSLTTNTAARIYLGQLQNRTGEEMSLSFEKFPYTGMSKTYCIDKQVADSACSGTALFTGVKTNYNLIGVNGNVQHHDCVAAQNKLNHVTSILEWAQKAGKATGFVTNTGVTSATPAAAYAHSASRKYESDADVLKYQQDPNNNCSDIAQQLIYGNPGKNLNVIFGGGRSKFLPKSNETNGSRKDKKNLIEDWLAMKKDSGVYISNQTQLLSLKLDDGIKHVLGLFSSRSLPYNLQSDGNKYPSLIEMTVAAVKILQSIKTSNGFVLLVESGRIDHAHHGNRAHLALDETVQLSETVSQTINMIDTEDTLIVVSSDHGHTMSFAGYNERGGDILGVVKYNQKNTFRSYTTLSYANGPGFNNNLYQNDIESADITNYKFRYPATISLKVETHGGDDVGVYALGPWSHLFSGVYEQNVIPHLIAYAACIGDGLTLCSNKMMDSFNFNPTVIVKN